MLHKIRSSKFADDTKITTDCLYKLRNDLFRLQGLASEIIMVFIADESKLIWVSLKKPDVKDQHTIHLPNKLKTESKLSLVSKTKLITAKSELLHSIELDTNCFLNKAYQDNPGVNEIYKHIRSLKTMYSSLPEKW